MAILAAAGRSHELAGAPPVAGEAYRLIVCNGATRSDERRSSPPGRRIRERAVGAIQKGGVRGRHDSRRLDFLHFGTDFLTVPPRVDQAEAHALYQGMASAVPLERSEQRRVGKECRSR